jgi:hypothetical protein
VDAGACGHGPVGVPPLHPRPAPGPRRSDLELRRTPDEQWTPLRHRAEACADVLSTEAVRTRSRELVLGQTLAEFMRSLELTDGLAQRDDYAASAADGAPFPSDT